MIQDKEVERLKQLINTKDEEIERLKQLISSKDEEIARLDLLVQTLESKTGNETTQVNNLNKIIKEL